MGPQAVTELGGGLDTPAATTVGFSDGAAACVMPCWRSGVLRSCYRPARRARRWRLSRAWCGTTGRRLPCREPSPASMRFRWGLITVPTPLRSRSLLVVSLILTATCGFAERGARIEGRVLDSVTRAPIEDVEVSLAWVGPLPRGGGGRPTKTDDRGRFTFEKIQGKVSLTCRKNGYVTSPPTYYWQLPLDRAPSRAEMERALGIVTASAGQVLRLEILLVRGGRLAGRVVFRTPEGIAFPSLLLDKDPEPSDVRLVGHGSFSVASSAPSAPDGSFNFPDLPPSTAYHLIALLDGYPKAVFGGITATAGRTSHIGRVVDRTDPTGVAGVIRFRGVPVRGGTVVLRSLPARTPECFDKLVRTGDFSCRGVKPGSYELYISTWNPKGPDAKVYARSLTVVLKPGVTIRKDVDLP